MIYEFEILRFSSNTESTLSLLFNITQGRKFLGFGLEDEYRTVKLKGKTRIPAGRYKLGLRKEGGFHNTYKTQFRGIHKGMIEVLNVPNFKYILWHVGNDDEDTEGCFLLGDTSQQNITKQGFIGSSRDAYKRIYPQIANLLDKEEECYVTYVDYDNND